MDLWRFIEYLRRFSVRVAGTHHQRRRRLEEELRPSFGVTELEVRRVLDATVSVSVGPSSVPEDAGTDLVYTFSRTGPPESALTVNFSVNGTAAFAEDYSVSGAASFDASSGSVMIPAGIASADVTVQILADAVPEGNETVTLAVVSDPAYTIGNDDSATATILNDDATLQIDDVSMAEEDAGNTDFTFTITLVGTLSQDIQVLAQTADDSATASSPNADYTAKSSNLTFRKDLASPQTASFIVNVKGDNRVELDETFFVNLTEDDFNGQTVTIVDAQAVGTILNADEATLSITGATVVEGNSGTSNLVFTLSLTNPVSVPLLIDFSTADGTAVAPSDYLGQTGREITIAANTQQVEVTVAVVGDTTVELDETVVGAIANLRAGDLAVVLGTTSAEGVIRNDDAAALSITGATVAEGDSGTSNLVFTLSLTNPVSVPLLIDFSTADGTAVAPSDYLGQTGREIMIAANTQQVEVTVAVVGDTTVELDETVVGSIANLRAGGLSVVLGTTSAAGLIRNDDSARVTISSGTVTEGTAPAGTTNLPFQITLTNPVDAPVVVRFSVADDTATAPSDYLPQVAAEVSIPAGVTLIEQSVQVVPDARVELDETVLGHIALVSAGGHSVTLGTDSAGGTILNDDLAAVEFSGGSSSDAEDRGGNLPTLLVRGTLDVPQTVRLLVTGGSATIGEDFSLVGDVVIAPGNYDGTALTALATGLTIISDTVVERDESILLRAVLQTPGLVSADIDGDQVARERYEYTISNDDRATLTMENVSVAEAEAQVTFEVVLSAAVQGGLLVDFRTADGTALSGDGDYVPVTVPLPSLTFTGVAGEARRFSVLVNDDAKVELDEYFTVLLSNVRPLDTSILSQNIDATDTADGTIRNDDRATLAINSLAQSETDDPQTAFVFTITLSAQVDEAVNLLVATHDGPGLVNAQDYQPLLDRPVVFSAAALPGPRTQTVTVFVIGDNRAEPNEVFEVLLYGLQAAGRDVTLVSSAVGTGEILNDDFAPIALSELVQLLEDTSTVRSSADGILRNVVDQDDPDPRTWSITIVSNPAHGTLMLANDGAYFYQPEGDYFGPDFFAYRVSDGTNNSLLLVGNELLDLPATVTLDVQPVNDPPSFAPPANLLLDPLNASVLVTIDQVRAGPLNEAYQFESPLAGFPRFEFLSDNPAVDTTFWQIDFASRDSATSLETWRLTIRELPFENTSALVVIVLDDGGLGPDGASIPGVSTFSMDFRLDIVVSGVPASELPGVALPGLLLPPASQPEALPMARTLPQFAAEPAEPSYVGSEPTEQLERYVEVRVITPSDDRGGVTETTVLRLPVQVLQDLTSLWPTLPDDRYRIYLIVRTERTRILEERLVLETAIRDGVPTEVEDLPTRVLESEPAVAPAAENSSGEPASAEEGAPAEGPVLDDPQGLGAVSDPDAGREPSFLMPALAAAAASPVAWREVREAVATRSHRIRTKAARLLNRPARRSIL